MNAALFPLMSGAIAAGYVVAALFFLRFWRETGDRFFALFATAFTLLAVQRVATVVAMQWTERTAPLYGLRLFAFLLILAAIVDKNRGASTHR